MRDATQAAAEGATGALGHHPLRRFALLREAIALAAIRGTPWHELSLPLATRDLLIVRSVDDPREPLRGGTEMIREELFESTFARWFADGRPPIEVSFGHPAGTS